MKIVLHLHRHQQDISNLRSVEWVTLKCSKPSSVLTTDEKKNRSCCVLFNTKYILPYRVILLSAAQSVDSSTKYKSLKLFDKNKIRGFNVVKYTTTSRKMLGKSKLNSTTGMISDASNSSLDLKGKFSVSVNFTDRQFELILLVSNSFEMKNILKGQIRFHWSPSILMLFLTKNPVSCANCGPSDQSSTQGQSFRSNLVRYWHQHHAGWWKWWYRNSIHAQVTHLTNTTT